MKLRWLAVRLSLLTILLGTLGLGACGLKGPLYLPAPPAPHKAPSDATSAH
ncbi:MAG: lipoprotein [Gammaproteobacteria bacterium]|nr:lipoprotein [Gammaproteobacteria bacterium]